jgi:hypothetical protein
MSDIAITAANVIASANAATSRGVAGATITAGMPVYLDSTVGKYKPADANGSGDATLVRGIALHGASDGQPLIFATEDPDFTLGGTVAAGTVVVVSATPGGIAPVADVVTGWFTTVLGVGKGSNKIAMKIAAAGVATP